MNHSDSIKKNNEQDSSFHQPKLGDTVDGFYIKEALFEGIFNNIYRVTHPDHDQALIMKVPSLNIGVPPSAFSAFETEVRILSQLHGVYTPRVIAKGDMATCPYVVLENIEHNALTKAIKRAPVSTEELCELMIPVCKAVHELHKHNVIHLDIKPGNIRNRKNGHVVILDFGSSHHTHIPDMYEHHHDEAPRTLDYVAPEQLHNIRHESRSDIYALGVILYQLATGKLPFGEANVLTVKKRLYMPPTPPLYYNKTLPPWLQEIILTCLQRRPKNRFATAKQIAHSLAHPNIVKLTRKAKRTKKPGFLTIVRTWLHSKRDDYLKTAGLYPNTRATRTPHILVALDLSHSSDDLKKALRTTLWRLANSDKQSFFTILTVLEKNDLSGTEDFTEIIKNKHPTHVHLQIELRQWMQPLNLPESRVNYQVIEGNVSDEILYYAKHNMLDQIVIGARGSSTLRRFLGSVSSKIAAEAPCTVTVVRSHLDEHIQQTGA